MDEELQITPTITITAPVLDNEAVDALTATLYKLGYNQVVTENVTRITAHKPPDDVKME